MKKLFLLALIILFIGCIMYLAGINSSPGKEGEDRAFIIEQGEGVNRISENLYEAGLIKSKFYFELHIWLNDKNAVLQAGEYALNSSQNIKEIAEIITAGQTVSPEREIKIIEGWNMKDINDYLVKEKVLAKDDLLNIAKAGKINNDFFQDAPAGATLEGYLFPDTYRIFKDASAQNIIDKMLDNFGRKLTEEMRADIKKQGKTIFEIITMASLVEKEVRSAEDMKIVSGIFWDRIKNGQALESCATLAYVLGENKKQYSYEDTEIDSPYNTYKYRGLPPGPISNPGLNAIRAAIYPEYTEYNYFLNRFDTGETVWSKTYDEHLENKRKYLQ